MNTKEALNIIHAMAKKYPASERHWLCIDCNDWEHTIPDILWAWSLAAQASLNLAAPMLRVIAEVIYRKGYDRGKAEQTNPLEKFWG